MTRAVVAVLTVLLLVACSDSLTVEQQVIASLEAMEIAAEEGEHFDFMEYVADPFDGQFEAMDRRGFHRFMIFQINQNRRLRAQFFPIHVRETADKQATADFNILITGGGGLFPEQGQLFKVETHWVNDGGQWLLSVANWTPVQLPD